MQQMPTRTEMDEVQREVYELRRRLRALEKSGMAAAAPGAPVAKGDEKAWPRRQISAAQLHDPRMLPMNSRMQFDPLQIAKQFADFSQRLQHGSELLRSVKDRDVQIATTPKTEVFRQDKTTLYHYEPMAERTVAVPVLVVYGLVGRYTMADLQEDRSLVRNLLLAGRRPVRRRLGKSDARGSVADDRRLRRRLSQRVRRVHLSHARARQHQCPGHLRRRRLYALPRCAPSGAGQESDRHHHAGRLSCRPGGRTHGPRIHQSVDAQPDPGGRRSPDRGERQSAG